MADDEALAAILAGADDGGAADPDQDSDASILANLLGGGGSSGDEDGDIDGLAGLDLDDLDLASLGITDLDPDTAAGGDDGDGVAAEAQTAAATAAAAVAASAVDDDGTAAADTSAPEVPLGDGDPTNAELAGVLAGVAEDYGAAGDYGAGADGRDAATEAAAAAAKAGEGAEDLDALLRDEGAGGSEGLQLEQEEQEQGFLVDAVVPKAPKPMGFGMKFGSTSVESLGALNWPDKFAEPGVEGRTDYIIVSRLQDEDVAGGGVANPAREAGVVAGDVVLEVNDVPIFATSDMKAASKGFPALQMRLVRRGVDEAATDEVVASTSAAAALVSGVLAPDEDPELAALLNAAQDGDFSSAGHRAGAGDYAGSGASAGAGSGSGSGGRRTTEDDDLDKRLSELGLDLNIDLTSGDLAGLGLDDADLADALDGAHGALPRGRRLVVNVHRRKNFGFGIMFAHVAAEDIAFDFDGKGGEGDVGGGDTGGAQRFIFINRFKEVTSGVGENPAEAAGLRPGDIILSINGVEVRDNLEVAAQLKNQSVIEVCVAREASANSADPGGLGSDDVDANTPGIDQLLSDLNRSSGGLGLGGDGDGSSADINQILLDADVSPMLDAAARRDLLHQLERVGGGDEVGDAARAVAAAAAGASGTGDPELTPYLLSPLGGSSSRPSEIDDLLREMQVTTASVNGGDGADGDDADGVNSHLGIIDLLLQDDDHAKGSATAEATKKELQSYVPESKRAPPGGSGGGGGRGAHPQHPKRLQKQHALELIIAVRPTISPALWGHVGGNSGGGGGSSRLQVIDFPAGGIKTVISCSYGSSNVGGTKTQTWSPYEETEKAAVDTYEFQRRVSVVRMEVDLSKSSAGMRLEQELKFEVLGFDGQGSSFVIGEAVIDVTELCQDGTKSTKRVPLLRRAARATRSSFNEDFSFDGSPTDGSPQGQGDGSGGGGGRTMQEINAYVTVVAEPMDPHRLVWHSQLKLADLKPAQTCHVPGYDRRVPIPSLLEYLWRQALEAGALMDREGLACVLNLPADMCPVSADTRRRFERETRNVKRDISNLRFNADLVDSHGTDGAAGSAGGGGGGSGGGSGRTGGRFTSGFLGAKAAEMRGGTGANGGRYSSFVYLFLWKTVVGTITPKLLSPASFQELAGARGAHHRRHRHRHAAHPNPLQRLSNLEERKISEIEGLLRMIPEPGHTVLLWVLDRIIDISEQSSVEALDLRALARVTTSMLWSPAEGAAGVGAAGGGSGGGGGGGGAAANGAESEAAIEQLAATELVLVLLRWRQRWRQYSGSFVGPLIELQAAKEARGLDSVAGEASAKESAQQYQYLVDKQQISEGDESLLNLQAMDEIKRSMDSIKSAAGGRSRLVVTALTAHEKHGIAVGTRFGETFVFDHFQKLQATLQGPARCSVQCLAFSKRDDFLAAGYLNADLVLFDHRQRKQLYLYHEKRQLRSIDDIKMQAFTQVLFLDLPGHGNVPQILGVDRSQAVWHLRFRRILNIWSCDPQPVVSWPTFRVSSAAAVPPPRHAAAQGRAPLVALTIVNPNIETVITEFHPKRKLVVNQTTVLCRLPVDTGHFDLATNSAVLLAWWWSDTAGSGGDGGGNDGDGGGPVLARSYGTRLEIFAAGRGGEWPATPTAAHRADADIVAMEWLCEDRVLYLSNDHHVSIYDSVAQKCVVTIRLQPWAVRGSSNGLTEYLAATCSQKFYFIALSGNADGKLGLVTLRPEDELMTIFINKNKWQKALSLGVQRWSNQRAELVGRDAAGLLDVYLNVHFEQERLGEAEAGKLVRACQRDILCAPECADLVHIIGMAFDFCLRCNRDLTKDLLEELDRHCRQRSATATNIFYQLLIANLGTGRMAPPSLSSIKGLIEHCGGRGRDLGRLERSLVEVKWAYDDAGDLIELCEERRILHGLLIHLCTKVFDPADFLTPLRTLTLTIKQWDRPRLQQRLLLYLYCCFNGLRFPDGPQLSTSEATQALNSTLCELFGVANFDSHSSPRSRARTAANQAAIPKALPLSDPDHPLRILLYKMSAEFLAVLEPVIVRIWQPQQPGRGFRRGGAGRNTRRGAGAAAGGRGSSGPGYNPYNQASARAHNTSGAVRPSLALSPQLTLEQMVAGLVIVSADWVDNSSGIDRAAAAQAADAAAQTAADADADAGAGVPAADDADAPLVSHRRQHVDVNRYEAQVCRNIYAFVARLLLQRIHMPTPASLLWGTVIELASVYRRLVVESNALDAAARARKELGAARGGGGVRGKRLGAQRSGGGGGGGGSLAAMQLQASAVLQRRKLDLQLRTCREAVAELVSRVPSSTDLDGGAGRDPMPMRAYNKLRSVELYRYAAEFAKKAESHTRALQAYLESPKNTVRQAAFEFLADEARRHDAIISDFDDFASGAVSQSQSGAAQRAQAQLAAGGKVSAGILHLRRVVSFNLRRLLQTDPDKTGQMMQTLWGGLTTKYIRGVLMENPRNLLSQLRKLRLHESCSSADVVLLAIKHEAYEAAAELKWRDGATTESEQLLVEGIKKVLTRLVTSFEASNKHQQAAATAASKGKGKGKGSGAQGGAASASNGGGAAAGGEDAEDEEVKAEAADGQQEVDVREGTEAITAYLNQAVTFCKEHWERLNKSMAAFQAELHDITKAQYLEKLEKRATQLWDALLNNFLTYLKRFTTLSDTARARLGLGAHSSALGLAGSGGGGGSGGGVVVGGEVALRTSRSSTLSGRRGTEIELRRGGMFDVKVQNFMRRLDTVRDFLHGCISRVLTDCRGQMRLDQVLQKLLSDKAADSLKFTEIKFLVLDMLRGVEFERIALNISTDAARQAVICGKRLAVDPAQRAAGAIEYDMDMPAAGAASRGGGGAGGGGPADAAAAGDILSRRQQGQEESKGADGRATDLGQFFLDIEQGVLPYPTVLQQFMDEESTTSALHITNRNQRRNFGAAPQLSAPRAKRHIQFPTQLLGGGGRDRSAKAGAGAGAAGGGGGAAKGGSPERASKPVAVQRPVGGISLDF